MRVCGFVLCVLLAVAAGAAESITLEGKLTQREGRPPAIATHDGKLIELDGDKATRGVINDKRLDGYDMQAKGHYTSPGKFEIDPIHTRAILVRAEGSMKQVTYWCDICSIRTYSPGPCWCCQRETNLDLRNPDQK